MNEATGLNDDFLDLLRALDAAEAEFIVVGAHALAVHGLPRATGDMDVLIRPTLDNAKRVMKALDQFGAPVASHGLSLEDLTTPDTVYQLGLPPRRIDLMTSISGVDFDAAVAEPVRLRFGDLVIPFLGIDALVRNKLAADRPKDRADLELLESARDGGENS